MAAGAQVISIDTNIALRFLLDDVPAQTGRARRVFAKPVLYISDVVIAEIAFVIERGMKFDREYVCLMLRTLIALPNLNHNDLILSAAIDLFEKRRSLSFVDCYAATEAKIYRTRLFTFDRKLINQGGSQVVAA